MWLDFLTSGIHLQVSVQLSLVALSVTPPVPGEDLLLFPAQCTGVIQQRSWQQNHSSAATSRLNSFKNRVSPNCMLTATVLVTSRILFCLLRQKRMNWRASRRGDRRALLGKAWGARTFVCHMGMQMPGEAQKRRMRGAVRIHNQAVSFSPWKRSARKNASRILLTPQSFRDQKGASSHM